MKLAQLVQGGRPFVCGRPSLLFAGFLILFSLPLFAQQKITGTVTEDGTGDPLIGVNIIVKGSPTGTVTDLDGTYEINVAGPEAVLQFSFVGYTTQEITVNDQTVIDIIMMEGVGLDEVTVTALGIARAEKSLGYAVQEVSGDDISQGSDANFVSTLAGRAAGVQVVTNGTGAGQSASVVIRGYSSLGGDNQPLFVVDGTPINNTTDTRTNTSGISDNMNVDYGNGAGDINPDDIESISVLKGANATALYGSRAANGAVIITTKSGKGRQGIGVSFNSRTTFETMLAGPEYQRVYGQGKNFDFAFVDGYGNGTFDGVDESWGPRLDGTLRPQHDSPTSNGLRGGDVHGLDFVLGASGVNLDRRGTITPTPFADHGDPVENFLETGHTLINNVSFFGSNDKGNFRVSYTNFDNKGMLPNTDLRRNTVAFSGDYNLSDRLTVSSNINYIRTDSDNRHVNGYGTESVMYLFVWWGQQIDVRGLRDYWQNGLEGFQQFNYNYNYHDNPYFTMYENTNGLAKDRIIGNVSAKYTITDDLSFMVRGGRDFFSEYRFIKRAYSTQRFPNGQYREDKINFSETNLDFLLSYNKQLNGNFDISANFGGNRMVQRNHFSAVAANALLIPGVYSFSNANGPLIQAIDRPERQINSLYGFAQLGWKNLVYLDVTGRNDWSSTLPQNNNSYFYPSVSLSAVVSDILQVPTSSALSFAKLRLGWAQVGSDTDPFRLNDFFVFSDTPWGNNAIASPTNQLPSTDLKPEKQTSYEVGADVRFFGNRLGVDLTYYNSISENQILAIELPASSGKTSRIINAGKIQNRGVELLVSATPVQHRSGLTWNTYLNFSRNRNEVLELPNGVDQYVYGGNGVTLVAQKGGSLGDMWGTGLVTVQDPNSPYYGEVIFKNGLVQQDNTLRKIGNFNPDFNLGWSNEISYKGFALSFLFDWRQGGDLLSRTRLIAATSGNVVETLWGRDPEFGGAHPGISDSGLTYIDEASGETHTDGVIGQGVREVVDADGNVSYVENDVIVPANAYHNNRYRRNNETEGMYDATFIKLRQARLSYSLPTSLLQRSFIHKASISLIGNNLWLWAKEFNHGDPELLSFGGGRYVPGVENATVPSTRSFGFSLDIEF
ncbi:MAG: SusC/RagA family TonB-linked outer membrane protein [Lewinella sp.]|nr:SusC/RagA family TonB-linked outer membrane protein [Lewinella sp.]